MSDAIDRINKRCEAAYKELENTKVKSLPKVKPFRPMDITKPKAAEPIQSGQTEDAPDEEISLEITSEDLEASLDIPDLEL